MHFDSHGNAPEDVNSTSCVSRTFAASEFIQQMWKPFAERRFVLLLAFLLVLLFDLCCRVLLKRNQSAAFKRAGCQNQSQQHGSNIIKQ